MACPPVNHRSRLPPALTNYGGAKAGENLRISVRILGWVEMEAVRAWINPRPAAPFPTGLYLVFDRIRESTAITAHAHPWRIDHRQEHLLATFVLFRALLAEPRRAFPEALAANLSGKFAAGFEGKFQPQPWQVQHTQRTGDA